ncbi:uncharacterized protein VP01_9049g1, partial [Puccinia sorghi]
LHTGPQPIKQHHQTGTPQHPSNLAHKSWVWSHFEILANSNKLECLAPDRKKGGKSCGALVARDMIGSTKLMSEHLKTVHHIFTPSKEKSNQPLLPNLIKCQCVKQCLIVTAKLLRQAIGYLVAEVDLPFSKVEWPSFVHLLELLIPQTTNMEYGWKSIKSIIDQMFIAHTQHIEKTLSCITHLSFAAKTWTSPNMKAFMAMTAHSISPEWNIVDLLVAMPAVK